MLRFLGYVLVGVAALPAAAQQSVARDGGPTLATRAQLQETLSRLARQAQSPEAMLIRARLDSGDFRVGDRILLQVEGEKALSDTFAVAPGTVLGLPTIGAVPLGGVLRSELQPRVEQYLARYFRDPVVHVRPLMRLLVEGDVVRPGFYAVAPDLPLADVITAAGGLTQRAKVTKTRVEREGVEIWGGGALQQALARGYSLDQLNLRAGDRVFVPARGDVARTLGIIGGLVAIPVAIYTIRRNH
jgi:protein involved in polysaccharide export with SLBB domain